MATDVPDASLCPRFHHAIELIGRRWSGAILQVMRGGGARFSDLAAAVPGVSDRMLSERLKELEAAGLIERRLPAAGSARVEYHLTPRGVALGAVLDAVMAWAEVWLAEAPALPPEDSRRRRQVAGAGAPHAAARVGVDLAVPEPEPALARPG